MRSITYLIPGLILLLTACDPTGESTTGIGAQSTQNPNRQAELEANRAARKAYYRGPRGFDL